MEPSSENIELPLRWLLSQHSLDLKPVVDIPVTFRVIQPTELNDPTPFLQPQAVVLSVGIVWENHPEQFSDYVARLAAAGVAAIGFGTGLIFEQVPTQLIAAARDHHIALFEVPHDTAFLSITQAVHREITRRREAAQELLGVRQQNATMAAITGGIDALVEQASKDLHAAIAIVDNDDRVVASAPWGTVDATQAQEGHTLARIRHRMLRFGDRIHEFLTATAQPLTSYDRQYIKHVIGLADLLLQRPQALRHASSSLNSLAMAVLLGLDAQPQHLRRAFARIADHRGDIRPVVIHTDGGQAMRRLVDHLDAALAQDDRELCHLALDATTTLLFVRGSRTAQTVLPLLGTHRRNARIAIGTPQPWDTIDMHAVKSLVTTAKSLHVGEYLTPEQAPLQWTQHPDVHKALDHRAHTTFGRLAAEDAERGQDLAHTLDTFLHSGANATATAQALGVHRHTVRSRLERIEELCEVDLSNPVTRAELLIISVTREQITT